jgi:uncharacterized metal-binding protein YceD (DUF177 family)
MSRPKDSSRLDAAVRVDHLPPEGRELQFAADAEQREALAERLNVSSVERLDVSLKVTKFRGGLRVLGHLDATVVQPCVVTFVPVTQEISEPLDRIFLPAAGRAAAHSGDEIFVDVEEEDEPDYFEGPEADLSELIVETLALAIDPYPRAPGAELPAEAEDADGETENPFAALKALRTDDDSTE